MRKKILDIRELKREFQMGSETVRALKGISSTKIHWSTFYNIVTQICNTYRALLEPPPAWYCAQIPTCRASGSVIYTKANEWLSNLG